jgi:hypothetical protein
MIAPPLSHRWAPTHHRLLGGTTDDTKRLAIALGVIRSAVRVVDRSRPPMTVDYAAHDPDAPVKSSSYTDFQNGAIRVNPSPLLDPAIDHGAALDTGIGFSLHEASHSQESRDRYKYLVKREKRSSYGEDQWQEVPAFEPMRIAAYLWNLVEDVRIEKVTSSRWPGFAPYFDRVLDYMWSELAKHHELPTEYKTDLTARLRTVFLACRYPGKIASLHEDAQMSAEIAWWQAWQHDYLEDRADTPETIQRGLDHLVEDPETAKEIEDHKTAEASERAAGERLRAQIDRLIREGVGGYEVCVTEGGEIVPLDTETAEQVRKLVREGLVEHVTVVTGYGASSPPVHVRKPEETTASRRAYVGRPDAETEALRAALVFRPSAPQHDVKLLKSGAMDDEELYRWGLGDMRVFSERVIEAKPDVFLGLLVDSSGSMYGRNLEIAQHLAQTFVWAVHGQEGVETAVWAHTADVDYEPSCEVHRIWEHGDPLSRLGLITEMDHSNNRDGAAICEVVGAMMDREQPEKVLIVLADGIPSGNGYGGRPAINHVRQVTRWALSRGVRVLGLAVDPHDIRPADQAAMYGEGNWLPFRDYASLPRQLTQLMSRFV